MRQKQNRDVVGRFTESARVNRLVLVSRFKQLFRLAFGLVFVSVPLLMAGIDHVSQGKWYFDGPAIEFPVIETAQAVEAEPVNIERLLRAVCMVESNCVHDRIGDNGRSFGAFQINLDAHPDVSIEQTFDFEFSKAWTLKHCKRYADDVFMFGVCHNGIGKVGKDGERRNTWYGNKVVEAYEKISSEVGE